jgi:hypothetical protein
MTLIADNRINSVLVRDGHHFTSLMRWAVVKASKVI